MDPPTLPTSRLASTSLPTLILTSLIGFLLLHVLYRIFLDPLNHIPGPLICRLTPIWMYYHSYIGDECTEINSLHQIYGPMVRIAPNEISVSDGAALAAINSEKDGFRKAPCYANFNDGPHTTIFSALDPVQRAPKAKAVMPVFSLGNVRAGSDKIQECVDRLLGKMKVEAGESRKTGKAVNVLNLSRSLAIDAMTSHLFGQAFGGVSEEGERLSASPFVDTLVAFGRFFFLPNWLFLTLEIFSRKLFATKEVGESGVKIDSFVEDSLRLSEELDPTSTFQGRLLKAGISREMTETECRDVIFAGTDSTGTNMSTIIWHLVRNPVIYADLRAAVDSADAQATPFSTLQSIKYLDAVVREGLRLSMANPTRFPRVVPPSGWTFTSALNNTTYTLPGGTIVGIQPLTLHLNPAVFSDPHEFKPERWLDGAATPEMRRDWVPFGVGSRACIARNLAMQELYLGTRAVARENVLEGARVVGEKIEVVEWFNAVVVGHKMEVVWGNSEEGL